NEKIFSDFFEQILNDETYNYDVMHTIAFTCKSDDILFDDSLTDRVLGVYEKLIKNKSTKIRDNAEFFLLYSLTQKKKSLLPKIKSLLEIISYGEYDLSSDALFKLNLIGYLETFWDEIPEESATYLNRIHLNNPSLVY